MNMKTSRQKALVIGGGIAGLLAARALSEAYAEVLVVERDDRPEQAGTRPGAPQSFHLHQVLPRGEQILESFFPGFLAEMQAGGAFPIQNTQVYMVNSYGTSLSQAMERGSPIAEAYWSGCYASGCRHLP